MQLLKSSAAAGTFEVPGGGAGVLQLRRVVLMVLLPAPGPSALLPCEGGATFLLVAWSALPEAGAAGGWRSQVSGAGGGVLGPWVWLCCVGSAIPGYAFPCCAQPFPPSFFPLEKV